MGTTVTVDVGGSTVRVTIDGNEALLDADEAGELARILQEASAQADDPTFETVGEVYGTAD